MQTRLANGFAYWQATPIDQAPQTYFDDMAQTISHVQQVAGANTNNIRILNGETGWPNGECWNNFGVTMIY